MRKTLLTVFVLVLSLGSALALTPATEVIVPAGARGEGSGGSVWQMDLYLLNTSPLTASVQIFWLERNQNNSGASATNMSVEPGQALILEDAIQSLVGLDSAGGAFRVVSDVPIAVNSRIYNLQGSTTFGQGFEGLTRAATVSAGGTTTAWIPGLQQSSASRSNLFAVADASGAEFTVEARSASGTSLGTRDYSLPPWSAFFAPLTHTVDGDPGDVVVMITVTEGGGWFAGSRVDSVSGDPFTLAAALVNAAPFNVEAFAGTYTGMWENTTFGSSGDASVVVTIDTSTSTVTFTMDLDGFVFGASDPPAETFTGTYNDNGFIVSGTSDTFGDVTISVNALGEVVGTGANVPNPGIDLVEFAGTATPTMISMSYTVHFAGSDDTAVGVINLSK